MKKSFLMVCMIVMFVAGVARADELDNTMDNMNVDICRQALGRTMCKDANEFNYVAKVKDGLYLFSTFYAKKEATFFCGLGGGYLKVQGREFRKITKTIPYEYDATSKCIAIQYSNPSCPTASPMVSCARKTLDEQAAEDFWSRPIPDLLDEDLQRALEDLNATTDQDAAPTQ